MQLCSRLAPGLLLTSLLILGNTTQAASLSGTIIKEDTREPLSFAEATIKELSLTAHADADGLFVFRNIPEGSYTIVVKARGFETSQWTNVSTDRGSGATLYRLTATAASTPAPGRSIRQSLFRQWAIGIPMAKLPLRGYQDYLGLLPGTVQRFYGGPLHVRGAPATGLAYFVDGLAQTDPMTGFPITAINHNSVTSALLHRSFIDPAYGWFSAGMGAVTTESGGSRWVGSGEAITDDFHGEKSDYALIALDIAGPVISKRVTLAAAGEHRQYGDSRDPGGPNDWNWSSTFHAKLDWMAHQRVQAGIGTRGSYLDWKYTPSEWQYNSVHSPRGVEENYSVWATAEALLGQSAKVNAALDWGSVAHRQGDGKYFDDIWAYGRPNRVSPWDETALYWRWDDMFLDPDSLVNGRHVVVHTPVEESLYTVTLPDGSTIEKSFIIRGDEGSLWDDYLEQRASRVGGRLQIEQDVEIVDMVHEFRAGYQFERHEVRQYHHIFPTIIYLGNEGAFYDIDRYGYDELGEEDGDGLDAAKKPWINAAYISDHFIADEFVIDAGIRYDIFDFDTEEFINPQQPLDPYDGATYADTATGISDEQRHLIREQSQQLDENDLKKRDSYSRVSPRVGISYPASDAITLHASYNHFVQRPPFEMLYSSFKFMEYKIRTGGYTYVFGNPSLEPTRTEQYDFGVEFRPSSKVRFGATWYEREVRNPIIVEYLPAVPNSYSQYANGRDFNSHGLEVKVELLPYHGVSGYVGYTYSNTDLIEQPAGPGNIAWTNPEPPTVFAPAEYDQEHKITAVLDLRSGAGAGPAFGDWHPFEHSGLSAIAAIGSGFPYSPTRVYNELTLFPLVSVPEGPPLSERIPWTARIDLRLDREFSAAGTTLDFYLWAINILDRDNVINVYSGTGEPDNTGWLETPDGQAFTNQNSSITDASLLTGEQKYRLRENDPANFDIPRQIRAGVRVVF